MPYTLTLTLTLAAYLTLGALTTLWLRNSRPWRDAERECGEHAHALLIGLAVACWPLILVGGCVLYLRWRREGVK